VVELEEKLREAVRACTREKERVLHFKALSKTSKGRLEETLRLQRTTRPPQLPRQRSLGTLPATRRASGVLSMSMGGGNQQKENVPVPPAPVFVRATEEAYREKLAALEKELAAAQVDNMGLRMKVGTLEQAQRPQPGVAGTPRGAAPAREGAPLPKSPLGWTASVPSPFMNDHAALSAEVRELRAQLAEVPHLRRELEEMPQLRKELEEVPRLRQELEELRRVRGEGEKVAQLRRELADARAAAAMVADATKSAALYSGAAMGRRTVAWGNTAGAMRSSQGGALEGANLSAELRAAWERVTSLQKRYDAAAEALASINSNHERALQQLEETHRQLNQVRTWGRGAGRCRAGLGDHASLCWREG
jgi:hypothetical protein